METFKKDNGLVTEDRFTFSKKLQETATSRAHFIYHTSVIHNFVFSFYSVSRLSLEQQYIIVCNGLWPECFKEMFSPKYIMALWVPGTWALQQIWKVKEQRETKLLKPVTHMEKNGNWSKSSLEYIFFFPLETFLPRV